VPPRAAAPAATAERFASADLGAHLRLWLVAAAGLTVDLWSKDWAFRTLGQGGRRVLLRNVLEFQIMLNSGALFGIGAGQTALFLVASVLALLLVLWMFAHSAARGRWLHVALGAILAGALGNMYDRMFVQLVAVREPGITGYYVKAEDGPGQSPVLREYAPPPGSKAREIPITALPYAPEEVGYVRDFIKIPTKVFGRRDVWPWVFNVADMLLVSGVGILALRLWCERGASKRRQAELDSTPQKA
jgi:signal peptidase II